MCLPGMPSDSCNCGSLMILQLIYIAASQLQLTQGKRAITIFVTPSADPLPCVWHLAMQYAKCRDHEASVIAELECQTVHNADSC